MKKVPFYFLAVLILSLISGKSAEVNAAPIKFDFQGEPIVKMWEFDYFEYWDDEECLWPVASSVQITGPGGHLATNGYFWGNASLSNTKPEEGMYNLAAATYTSDGVSLTVKGSSTTSWDMYTTMGAAISANQSQNLSYGDYTLPNATYAYSPQTNENTFLVMFDATFGQTREPFVDTFIVPTLEFNGPVTIQSLDLANTVYVVNSMTGGDGYSAPYDYSKNSFLGVTISGLDEYGNKTGEMSFLLADFLTYSDEFQPRNTVLQENFTYYTRLDGSGIPVLPADPIDYYSLANGILEDWATVSLEALGQVHGLQFSMFCSDISTYGFNTPTYFALDNIVLAGIDPNNEYGVPEPAAWGMMFLGCFFLVFWKKRRVWRL